jgi:GNAT superfamily N-acetyltransferase
MIVRRARATDAAVLSRLRWEFRASIGAPDETEPEFIERCLPWMRDRLAGNGSWWSWVAEDGGRVVGTVWLQLIEKLPNPVAEPERHGYVSSLYVEPAVRGRGTGSALLTACLEACRELEVDAVILWPTAESRALYLRHGFSVRDDLLERRS